MSYTQDEKSTGLELLTWSQLANGDILTVGDASDSGRLKGVLKSELQSQLDSKEPAKGADDNFVTDAEKNVISNTSGTNTGDETTSSIKSKLGISVLSGNNTGDQDLSGLQPLDSDLSAIAGLTPTNDDLLQRKAGVWTNRTPAQVKTDLSLTKSDVGLGNVDNTTDANKPVSTAQQTAIDAKVDNTAYDATSWNGVTDKAPSKDAVRDKFASIDSTLSGLSGSVEVLNTATLGSTQNNYSSGMSASKNILTILNIIPSASFKITGIDSTSVENGKRIRIYNQSDRLTSSGRMILFERLFSGSGSSAANRFMYPLYNGLPLILTPDSFVEFQYNTFDNYWHMVYASEWGNPNVFFDCYSDCHANAPFIPTTATAGTVGSTSGSILSGTTQKTIGTMLHTITTNAGRAYLGTQQSAMYFGGYCALGMARVQFGALADATDDYVSYNLFTDASGGTTAVDQVGFVYNRSASTDWRTSTAQNVGAGGGETVNTVTGFTPSTTVFHTIGAFVNGDGTNADFFYSADNDTWTFATSHTTNIPTGTSKVLGFMTGFTKTAGSGSKTMNTDWLGYKLMMKRGV